MTDTDFSAPPPATPHQDEVDAFLEAAKNGDNAAVAAYLDAYGPASVDIRSRDGLMSALLYAAYAGNKNIVTLLIKNGADVNQRGFLGRSPLMLAIFEGHNEVVEILLDSNASTTLTDHQGWTALGWAQHLAHDDIADTLRDWPKIKKQKEEKALQQEVHNQNAAAVASAEDSLTKLKQLRPPRSTLQKRP